MSELATSEEPQVCTICASVASPGFYTGCLIKDGYGRPGQKCDNGVITEEHEP